MKKQLLAISLCILILALIPVSVLGATTSVPPTDPKTTEVGRTMIRGLVFGYKTAGLKTHFFAIRIHYREMTGLQTIQGVLRFARIEVGSYVGGYMNDFVVTGFFTYMFAANFRGGISVL